MAGFGGGVRLEDEEEEEEEDEEEEEEDELERLLFLFLDTGRDCGGGDLSLPDMMELLLSLMGEYNGR